MNFCWNRKPESGVVEWLGVMECCICMKGWKGLNCWKEWAIEPEILMIELCKAIWLYFWFLKLKMGERGNKWDR